MSSNKNTNKDVDNYDDGDNSNNDINDDNRYKNNDNE